MTAAIATEYATVVEWDTLEGTITGYNDMGLDVVTIEPLLNRDYCAKWGETYRKGRRWSVSLPDGSVLVGHSDDLRKAKKDAHALLLAKCS